jgi:hypothetical protein
MPSPFTVNRKDIAMHSSTSTMAARTSTSSDIGEDDELATRTGGLPSPGTLDLRAGSAPSSTVRLPPVVGGSGRVAAGSTAPG